MPRLQVAVRRLERMVSCGFVEERTPLAGQLRPLLQCFKSGVDYELKLAAGVPFDILWWPVRGTE